MIDLTNEIVVIDLAGSNAIVRCNHPEKRAKLTILGFSERDGNLVRPVSDAGALHDVISALIRAT